MRQNKPPFVATRYRHIIFPGEAMKPQPVDIGMYSSGGAGFIEPASKLSGENAELLEWLFAQAGLNVNLYRVETLKRRLPACLRALRVRSTSEARRQIEQDHSLIPVALDTMLVGVTWFFRDAAVFDMLRDAVLPSLVEGRKNLYVWSVGCSDGAELYSVALLLSEMGALGNSYLLGTDCRAEAIARCRQSRYNADALKYVPASLIERYFDRLPGGWQIVSGIRSATRWRIANVLQGAEPGIWDLILCRNTGMYLRAEAMNRLWEQFEMHLRPGGVLVLGKAERPVGTKRFSFVAPCIYRRKRG
ncbi:MAG: CheR family methyltransferase [Gemmataceae bacterium]